MTLVIDGNYGSGGFHCSLTPSMSQTRETHGTVGSGPSVYYAEHKACLHVFHGFFEHKMPDGT